MMYWKDKTFLYIIHLANATFLTRVAHVPLPGSVRLLMSAGDEIRQGVEGHEVRVVVDLRQAVAGVEFL